MTPHDATELLERAAASVTPAETDPASHLVALGRRSVRRRRAWTAAGTAAVAVMAVVAVPFVTARPDQPDPAASPATVDFGGLTVAVPTGWRTARVATLDPCAAQPHTVYLAEQWKTGGRGQVPAPRPDTCGSESASWMAVVRTNSRRPVFPELLVVKDKQLIQAWESGSSEGPTLWTYGVFTRGSTATSLALAGDEKGREQLLERVTWPARPPAPPSGGLTLPGSFTSATSSEPALATAQDATTLNQLRTRLGELRDPVPAGEECTLRGSHAAGIAFDLDDHAVVMLGDATCPQAVSTLGGRVRIPAGLGQELLGLIEASDRAAADRKHK